MFVYELKNGNVDPAFWAEVMTHDLEAVRTRLLASRLDWQLVWRSNKELFIVRVPVSREEDFATVSKAGPLVHNAAKGLTAVIKRPNFLTRISIELNDPWGAEDKPRTLPNTDARHAEGALISHLADLQRRPPSINLIRDLVRLYLRALSKVQARYGIRGNGEQSLRFISHFWNLGDVGVAARFERVASRLSKHAAPSSGPESEPKSSKDSLDTRLTTLEQRLAHRGPR